MDHAEYGLDVRVGDYDRPATLEPALAGIDTLLLVSGNALGRRVRQHRAVVNAAVAAGVRRLAYTSITRADSSAMLLNTRGSFFEFIRYEDREKPSPERLWVGTIRPGERYVPVISNANGLWAYVLGDVVEFTDVRPPLLRIHCD